MTKPIARLLGAVAATTALGAAFAQDHRHQHHFAPDVDAFHSVLAPVWHARPGAERSQDACAKAGRMEALAKEIRSADAAALRDAVAALKTTCKAGPAEVDGALHDVHEAFHRLIEAPPAK